MGYYYINVGEKFLYNEKEVIISRIDSINSVTVENVNTNEYYSININELKPIKGKDEKITDLESLSEKKWALAIQRFEIISPLIEMKTNKKIIEEVAIRENVSVATLYRWIKLYKDNGTVASILGKPKTGGKGNSRLNPLTEEIIETIIQTKYLNTSRKSINKIIRLINDECIRKNAPLPHPITVRSRINNLSEEEVIKKRFSVKEAKYKFSPILGSFPEVEYPLNVVQIDHTKVDIILVDEHTRKPYKRPWITLAIDVFSRMVVGFYLSFDTPGALGTGLCISHCILPKELWLGKIGVDAEWPCWGKMNTIHLDNAKEFRGNMLKKAYKNYNINIEFRPVATPHWGGHIERLLGTFAKEIHDLSGTTFSSPAEKKNYDSKKNAALTLSEFEKWLTLYITNVYHKRIHSSLKTSPIEKYKSGIFGNENQIGTGIMPKIIDERRLKLDFMPYVERTIQEYGVLIEHITYYHDVLRKYIHAKEQKNKKKFIFRRDPRDISIIYFYDPELNEYFDIPYRDSSLPAISIWEFNDTTRILKKEDTAINEKTIFDTYRKLDEIESKAIRETKKIRRFKKSELKITEDNTNDNDINENYNNDSIIPFEDIDDETFD